MSTLAGALRIMTGGPRTVAAPPAQRDTTYLGGLSGGLSIGEGGLRLGADATDIGAVPTAYRCVQLIAANLSSVPMTVLVGDEATDEHPIARLWNVGVPGAQLSARITRETAYGRLELTGESFVYLDRGETADGPIGGLHAIFHPVSVVVTPDPTRRTMGKIAGYIVKAPGGDVPLLPSEVLWLRYPHPTKPWAALAPWRAALNAVELDAYAKAWQRGEYRNGARPSMLISLGEVSDAAYEAALAMIRTRVDGHANASKSMVIRQQQGSTAKPTAQPLSLTPAEMSYIESRIANADEMALAFGVHPDLLRGGSTYENRAAAKTALWSDTLLPKLDVIASEADRQLLPTGEESAAWDLSNVDALRDSLDSLIRRASDAMYPDIVLVDEARAMLGYDPLPFGAGQYTLTAYRERVRLGAQADFGVLPVTPGGRSTVRLIRHRGATTTHRRPVVRAAEDDVLAIYDRHERIGRQAVARLAERQERAVLRELKSKGRKSPAWHVDRARELRAAVAAGIARVDDDGLLRVTEPRTDAERAAQQRVGLSDIFDVTFWRDETVRALEDFMTGIYVESGRRTASMLDASWDHLDPLVIDRMTARLAVLADVVTDTTRAALDSQLLQIGVEEGESIDELADRLRSVFDTLSKSRAETIARTETVGGFNAAAHTVAAASGLVVTRTWLATDDSRTRPSHQRLNGHRITGVDGTYPIGVRYPGDPEGPASETINCRCVELFDTSDAGRAAHDRYHGRITR